MKDLDLKLFKMKKGNIINLSVEDMRNILDIISSDVDFLLKQGLMDYSVLLAVEEREYKFSKDRDSRN